jgi:hypothetical protein
MFQGGMVMGFRLCALVLCVLAVPCFAAESIPESCPGENSVGGEGCPPADWIFCPEHEGVTYWVASVAGLNQGGRLGPDLDRITLDGEPDGVWLVCYYGFGKWTGSEEEGDEEISEAIQIEGQIVQFGGPLEDRAGVSVLRGSLKRDPISRQAEDPAKDTDLAGVHLGWSEDELRAFAAGEGYGWEEGTFADYAAENLRVSNFPAFAGRRVTLTRADGAVEVIFHLESMRVREVLLHLKGKDVVQAQWRATMLRFGPIKNDDGYGNGLGHYWKSKPEGVIVEFWPKGSHWDMDSDEAFLRLVDLNP